jgi:hypothetical protein
MATNNITPIPAGAPRPSVDPNARLASSTPSKPTMRVRKTPSLDAEPKITSVGPPSSQHATRIVGFMLDHLHSRRMAIQPTLNGIIVPSRMGTPVGQMRVFERLKRAMGGTALDLHITTAKRGRFLLMTTEWQPIANGSLIKSGALPPNAGLAAVTAFITAVRHQGRGKSETPLVVTRHALARMAERAEVRTIEDMLDGVRDLWKAAGVIMSAPDEAWRQPPRGNAWQVPVAGGVAVLAPNDDGSRQLAAVTVLTYEMASRAAFVATNAIVAAAKAVIDARVRAVDEAAS